MWLVCILSYRSLRDCFVSFGAVFLQPLVVCSCWFVAEVCSMPTATQGHACIASHKPTLLRSETVWMAMFAFLGVSAFERVHAACDSDRMMCLLNLRRFVAGVGDALFPVVQLRRRGRYRLRHGGPQGHEAPPQPSPPVEPKIDGTSNGAIDLHRYDFVWHFLFFDAFKWKPSSTCFVAYLHVCVSRRILIFRFMRVWLLGLIDLWL